MQRRTLVLTGTMMATILLASGTAFLACAENAKIKPEGVSFTSGESANTPGMKATQTAPRDISYSITFVGKPRGIKSPVPDTGSRIAREFSMPGTSRNFSSLHLHVPGTVIQE